MALDSGNSQTSKEDPTGRHTVGWFFSHIDLLEREQKPGHSGELPACPRLSFPICKARHKS